MFTRREILVGGSAALLLSRARVADARGKLTDPLLDSIVERALAGAKAAGATYADVRIVRRQLEQIATREDHIANVSSDESYGVAVRVIAGGAWGFAASSKVTADEADRIAKNAVLIAKANAQTVKRPVTLAPVKAVRDVWQTPLTKDPFKISLADKADLLIACANEAMKVPGVKYCNGRSATVSEWKLFASSEGSVIEQAISRVDVGYEVTALDDKLGFATREHDLAPRQAGWEWVENSTLLTDARKIGEQAVEKLKAPTVAPGKKDLILDPAHLWLTIHESVGHPTELDRALGYEANMAGTSFATTDKRGKLKYAAPHVTLYADKTTEGGLATCGYDDDGVKTQRWNLIENGVFVGYQTTREQAGWIGESESRGTCYAQDYRSVPFQRMPNVSLAPGAKQLGLKDLVAATDDGILIAGNGSYSIDHQRYNFQFGGQMFYEVKKGKVTHALRDVAYQSNTVDFWNATDLLGGSGAWEMGGTLFDGKGEPGQVQAVSHGCPPARFKQISVINTGRKA